MTDDKMQTRLCERIAELEKDKEYLDKVNNEQKEVILQLNEQIEQLSNDNHVLKTSFITQQEQIEKYKNEKKYYDNLCHKKTVECDDLRKGIKQFQSDNEKFIKRIDELQKENARLKWEVKEITEDNDYYQKVNNEQTEVILKLNDKIEKMKNCLNCANFRKNYKLCLFSGGDEDYTCRNRKWELAE